MRYENAYDAKTMDEKELPALPKFRYKFALCVIKDRFIILSGGVDAYDLVCSQVFKFDTKTEQWVTSPAQACLKTARQAHASCATESAAFVYGGNDQNDRALGTMELLRFDDK